MRFPRFAPIFALLTLIFNGCLLGMPARDDIDWDYDGWTINQGDCNHDDPNIHPGAEEVCDDGIDNDCDDLVDNEDLDCQVDTGDTGE